MLGLIDNPQKFKEAVFQTLADKVIQEIQGENIPVTEPEPLKEMVDDLPDYLVTQFESRADNERRAGSTIEINHRANYISVEFGNGEEYFFQGDEADDLLDEVPDNIDPEDYILAIAQNW